MLFIINGFLLLSTEKIIKLFNLERIINSLTNKKVVNYYNYKCLDSYVSYPSDSYLTLHKISDLIFNLILKKHGDNFFF